jgi:predicted small secreted protein
LIGRRRIARALELFGIDSHQSINRSGGITMLSKLIYAFALLTTFALGACNTMTGVGKDVEKGGQKIQEESKEQQRKM